MGTRWFQFNYIPQYTRTFTGSKAYCDGSETEFKPLNIDEFHSKCEGETVEANIYKNIQPIKQL